jgi:AMMECR1 domain-containing protein
MARAHAHERFLSGKRTTPNAELALARALGARERKQLEMQLCALLAWQRDLARWPSPRPSPRAIPFVSLYARGRLTGCMGSGEGAPGERLARAFVSALGDARFPGPMPAERATLSAQVAYVRDVEMIAPRDVEAALEPGTHGVAIVRGEGAPVMLLPQVARDDRLDAPMMLKALAQKSGADVAAADARLLLFVTDVVAARLDDGMKRTHARTKKIASGVDAAAAWLSTLVGRDGSVTFAVDARRRERHATGVMHHGRAAVLIQALSRHGGFASEARRATSWLEREIARGLAHGESGVASWPKNDASIAGTLALAMLAGARVESDLVAFARSHEDAIAREPWHAAQVVAALGPRASPSLWASCTNDLEKKQWAPWTALAARARNDASVFALLEDTLVASIRTNAPHEGGANVTPVPETALTAITVEALDAIGSKKARRAADRGRAFLTRWQLCEHDLPAPLSVDLAAGAFPASPVLDALRCDIVAHALIATMNATAT